MTTCSKPLRMIWRTIWNSPTGNRLRYSVNSISFSLKRLPHHIYFNELSMQTCIPENFFSACTTHECSEMDVPRPATMTVKLGVPQNHAIFWWVRDQLITFGHPSDRQIWDSNLWYSRSDWLLIHLATAIHFSSNEYAFANHCTIYRNCLRRAVLVSSETSQ